MKKYEGWTKGAAYSGGGQDWIRNNILVHDNGWGTIQISLRHGEPDEYGRIPDTMFAAVHYFSGHRGSFQSEMCQFNKEQAFDTAIAMCNGLVDVNFDLTPAIDLNPQRNN